MREHPFGLLSLLPPLLAIVLAIVTRRVVLSLCTGVFLGALILADGNLLLATAAALEDHLWTNLIDPNHLRVFAFTALMGAMVGIIHCGGGMRGIVNLLAPLVRNRRGGQLTTWALGLIIFFDDYANTLLLGGTMQPVADRVGISREKLAYLVDSTAAPVAGLALVSTWVAGEIGFIEAGFADLPGTDTGIDGFGIFIASIPYRFYVLWALLLVPLVALLQRDIGPMLGAERNSLDQLSNPEKRDASAARIEDDQPPARFHNAVVPILVVLGVTCWLLISTGHAAILAAVAEAGPQSPIPSPNWFTCFSRGDSYLALMYGSLAGLFVAVVWLRGQRLLSWSQLRDAGLIGARSMLPALIILWLAWTLSGMTERDQLGTAVYLGNVLEGNVSAAMLPTCVFVLAGLVAFATGTSWGTMGILMPLVIRLAWQLLSHDGQPVSPEDPLLLGSVGGVLAGAVFGDHCSPISDTTVLSSHACGCDHVAHVWTQLPYALLAGTVSILLGTLPIGFGVNPWVLLPIGVILMAAVLWIVGRRG